MADSNRNTKVDLIVVAVLWAIATAAAYWWLSTTNFHPMGASTSAVISDDSFDLLMKLSIPVTTFVLIVIGYSVVRFRAAPDDARDSSPVRSNRLFVGLWIAITAALAVYVIINPGFTGLAALEEGRDAEMAIEVTAQQWSWTYRYVNEDIEITQAEELIVPVDVPIVFVITSRDVIHSFWIPAFRIKQDAVPGVVTRTYTTATEIGDYAGDDGFRVQCAELCGTGHANMSTRVTVVSQDEFAAWVEREIAEGVHE